jgi:hypothetical protein
MFRKTLFIACALIIGVIATPSRTEAYGCYHAGYTHYSSATGLHHYGYTDVDRRGYGASYGAHYGYHYGGYRAGGAHYGYYRRY